LGISLFEKPGTDDPLAKGAPFSVIVAVPATFTEQTEFHYQEINQEKEGPEDAEPGKDVHARSIYQEGEQVGKDNYPTGEIFIRPGSCHARLFYC
jgi:hypothetical protein